MRFEISFDDGHELDTKALGYLIEHELAPYATFYIPTVSALEDEEIEHIANYAVIGGHTVNHPLDLKKVEPDNLLVEEIEGNKLDLEDLLKKPIESFCYPRGRYDERVKGVVVRSGFKEARTTDVLVTDINFDPFEKPTTIHMFAREEYKGEDWFNLAKSYFQLALDKKDKGYFHLWGHSWELEKFDEWDKFDEILAYLKSRL